MNLISVTNGGGLYGGLAFRPLQKFVAAPGVRLSGNRKPARRGCAPPLLRSQVVAIAESALRDFPVALVHEG